MISVIGKQLIFPNEEQRFVMGDGETTSRTFVINRYEADRIDLSPLIFRLDVQYKAGQKDTLLLTKVVEEKQMKLHWNVKTSDLKENGTVFVALRAFDEDGVVRWTSDKTPIFVNNIIDTPSDWNGDLTELEQMEGLISGAVENAERAVHNAELAVEKAVETVAGVEDAKEAAEAAANAALEAAQVALNAKGPKGDTGETGPKGDKGDTGDTGAAFT
ncbi:MAG: collagen-like protein, partial [Anaerotignum sp.]|nr:collagen-like protein [Anaerotignum sp.]